MSDSEASIEESDDEFSYDAPTVGGVPPSHLSLPKKVLDQHYDEAVDVSASDADSARSPIISSAKHLNQPMNPSNSISSNHTLKGNLSNASSSFDSDDDEPTDVDPTGFAAVPARPAQLSNSKPTSAKASPPSSQPTQQRRTPPLATQQPMQRAEQNIASGSEDEDEEDEDDTAAAPATRPTQAKLYQASDFAHIHVHAEIQELFVLIGRHKPQDIELDTKFLPFIPDYIPAIGEIDPFIKVSAPQNIGGVEDLGLKVVDEPSSNQSDPSVLEMSLRVLSKGVSTRSTNNAKVENAEKNPKRITKWIESLEELHRAKPQTKVTYTKPMPDIDTLMQVWPQDVEDTIKEFSVGSSDDQDPLFGLNLSTMELAKLGCALMDIPIHGDDKIIESLHLMFSVYQEFSQNAHFQGQ